MSNQLVSRNAGPNCFVIRGYLIANQSDGVFNTGSLRMLLALGKSGSEICNMREGPVRPAVLLVFDAVRFIFEFYQSALWVQADSP
jgi:hypothetical protein